MASTLLTKNAQSVTNAKKYTVSFWCKKALSGINQYVLNTASDGSNRLGIIFNTSEQLEIYGQTSGSENAYVRTTRLFRDPSSFYHIVVAFDTTQSTAADRIKIYVNGTQETSMVSTNYPSQNADLESARNHYIGGYGVTANHYFGGVISHFHFIDGTQYAASNFGSTDSTTGEWKINTSPSVTYGSAGYFILKDGNSVTDQSGNSNNFTVSTGTLTNTEDCSSNVFATMNPLYKAAGIALSNGNLTSVGSASYTTVCSTMAVNSGKWYWEAKCNTASPNSYFNVGVIKTDTRIDTLSYPADSGSSGYILAKDGYIYYNGSQSLNTGTTVSPGDIVGFILDMDAGTLKLKKNGSDVYSGNAVVSSLNTGDFWYVTHGANPSNVNFNFGNGFFGTTAISSEGTNASGIGKFEYDVPANHTAICTKGLNE